MVMKIGFTIRTPSNYKGYPFGVELQTDTERENNAATNDAPLAANHVTHGEREECAKECPGRQNGHLMIGSWIKKLQ